MVLGGATEKLQTTIELAEDLYEKVTALRAEVQDTQKTVLDTNDRVASLEAELASQRKLLTSLAEEHGIDVDEVESGDSNEAAGDSSGATGEGSDVSTDEDTEA